MPVSDRGWAFLLKLVGPAILLGLACTQARAPGSTTTIVQAEAPPAPAAVQRSQIQPTEWDTDWSQIMGVKLLQTYDSSGPPAWDPVKHPLVYVASEGPGYAGLTSGGTTLPGFQMIDANTKEVVASAHYDLDIENPFEPHGTGVSPDGRWIYVPTAAGADFGGSKEAGRLLVIDSRTHKLAQVLQVPGRPHHIKAFRDPQGNDRVLVYSWSYGAYILDPKDQNRVVGAVPNGELRGEGYLAFVDPSGRWLFYSVRPPVGVEAQGTVAIIDTRSWKYVRSIGTEDSSPIYVAFSGEGKFAFVSGGHESTVAKIDMSADDPKDWKLVKVARAGTEGPYGINLSWDNKLLVAIGKGEGSHNQGITVGLVDPNTMARPVGEVYTGCKRGDHALLHPDPSVNELWISCNASFETVVFDMAKRQVKARIPSPNGGSSHNGAFVRYTPDFTGEVLSDQNGFHGSSLQAKLSILDAAVQRPTGASSSITAPPLASGGATGPQSLVASGEMIFQTAGGVGCQACHGADARGNIGPNIRGKKAGDIEAALKSVDAMSIVQLSREEIEAVTAYLQYLQTQP